MPKTNPKRVKVGFPGQRERFRRELADAEVEANCPTCKQPAGTACQISHIHPETKEQSFGVPYSPHPARKRVFGRARRVALVTLLIEHHQESSGLAPPRSPHELAVSIMNHLSGEIGRDGEYVVALPTEDV